MSRVIDDIVHYFKTNGVDILAASSAWSLIMDNTGPLLDVLRRRSYPDSDLLEAVVLAEQQIQQQKEELRRLWAERRYLRGKVRAFQRTTSSDVIPETEDYQ